MKLKGKDFYSFSNKKDFNSSAIETITVNEALLQIFVVFCSNTERSYCYSIKNSNFMELLGNTIKNKESIGQFVSKQIKLDNIQQINTDAE